MLKGHGLAVMNQVINQDCVEGLKAIEPATIDLVFADPPFNIGYDYDVYHDKKEAEAYIAWTRVWGELVVKALKPNGSFWLAIGDEFAAELKMVFQYDLGLHCRNWVVWYYTFGVNCTHKFNRSHAHLFNFIKDSKNFCFNDEAVRVPSARQLIYADKRSNPKGRLPDDTWILRPQDLEDGFEADGDTWHFPRVCGTFKERAGWHGCQMPEQLLGRIVKVSSNPGEIVLDPFAGSGTTLVVAKKLGRRFLGFELSQDYTASVNARLETVRTGDRLEGGEEPKVDPNGKLKRAPSKVRVPPKDESTPLFQS